MNDVPPSDRYRTVAPQTAFSQSSERVPPDIGGYRILSELGRGGMGRVFAARDERLGRDVAIKLMLPSVATEVVLRRFEVEGQSVAKLSHPGIVAVHGVGVHRGRPFLVMDLVAGESLAARLERGGPLEPRAAAELALALAEATHYAHGRGILHRDLKPDNVLLRADRAPVITDFGLAKDLSETRERLTRTGELLGTPAYMPPEQASGDGDRVGPRSDVYSLGAVLFAALTGRAPFEGLSTMNIITRVLKARAPALRSLRPEADRALEAICAQCLAKDPAGRYASADDLAADLRRYLAGEDVAARSSRPLLGAWIAAAVGVAALAGVALWAFTDPAPVTPLPPPPPGPAKPVTPTPEPVVLTPEEVRKGSRAWREVEGLERPVDRFDGARAWLERYPRHPLAGAVRGHLAGLGDQAPLAVLPGGYRDIAQTGDRLVTVSAGEVEVWQVDPLRKVRAWPAHVEGGISIAASHDASTLAIVEVRVPSMGVPPRPRPPRVFLHTHDLRAGREQDSRELDVRAGSVDFAWDGKLLICTKKAVRVVDPETRDVVRRLRGFEDPLEAIAVSPSGKLLVAGSGPEVEGDLGSFASRGALRVWALDAEREPLVVRLTTVPYSLAFLDEERVAVGRADGRLQVYSARDGQLIYEARGELKHDQVSAGMGLRAHSSSTKSVASLGGGWMASVGGWNREQELELHVWAPGGERRLRALVKDRPLKVVGSGTWAAVQQRRGRVSLWRVPHTPQ